MLKQHGGESLENHVNSSVSCRAELLSVTQHRAAGSIYRPDSTPGSLLTEIMPETQLKSSAKTLCISRTQQGSTVLFEELK